jgi:uncharacterized membrane protein YoaK (UPF0700 family)
VVGSGSRDDRRLRGCLRHHHLQYLLVFYEWKYHSSRLYNGQGNGWAAMHSALAIVFFVGGSFAGTLLAHSAMRGRRRLVFGGVAALLALFIGFTQLGFSSDWVPISVVSFAMGAMNTALSRVGAQNVSLTFVTGTLSRIGMQLALAVRRTPLPDSQGPWDTHLYRTFLMAGIWAGFLTGALLAGVVTPRLEVWVLLFPILILSALAVFDRTTILQPDLETRVRSAAL